MNVMFFRGVLFCDIITEKVGNSLFIRNNNEQIDRSLKFYLNTRNVGISKMCQSYIFSVWPRFDGIGSVIHELGQILKNNILRIVYQSNR